MMLVPASRGVAMLEVVRTRWTLRVHWEIIVSPMCRYDDAWQWIALGVGHGDDWDKLWSWSRSATCGLDEALATEGAQVRESHSCFASALIDMDSYKHGANHVVNTKWYESALVSKNCLDALATWCRRWDMYLAPWYCADRDRSRAKPPCGYLEVRSVAR